MNRKLTVITEHGRRVAFFAAVLVFALANVGLYCFRGIYRPPITTAVLNSQPNASSHLKEWSWWLARTWLEQSQAPDVVLFGSSQMGSAVCSADAQYLQKLVDALTHRRCNIFEGELNAKFQKPVTVFNLASPGAMASDAYMASKALFRTDFQPKVVVIGISPRDFIDNSMPYVAATEPYKFYSRFVSPGKLITSAYHDTMAWLQYACDAIPFHRLGQYLNQIASENAPAERSKIHESSNALAAVLGGSNAEPGKWLVPANIPPMWVDNTKEYKNRFKNPDTSIYEHEKAFFNAFLREMHARNITVVVVGMPSMQMNRALLPYKFWERFRSAISSSCAVHNAQFLDLTDSPQFVKGDYLDTVHLNAKGGAKLFKILAQYVSDEPQVAAYFGEPSPVVDNKDAIKTAAAKAKPIQ